MENMFKRFLSMALAVLMVLSMMPTTAFATETEGGETTNPDTNVENVGNDGEGDGEPEAQTDTVVEVATFDELVAALAANNDSSIVITAQIVIPEGETVTLDLNGKTVNANKSSTTNHIYALSNKGTLTITDTSAEKTGSINSRGIYNYGSLTLEAGAVNGIDGNGGYAVNNQSGSTFVMNGGIVAATYEDDYQSDKGGYDATALKVPAGCTATLNGGKIVNVCDYTYAVDAAGTLNIPATSTIEVVGTHGAIYVSAGTTTINAGEFSVPADEYNRTDNVLYVAGGSLVINGGTFTGDGDTASGGCCVCDANGGATINGGTFGNSSGGDVWGTTGTTIKGGTFANLTETQHVAKGYQLGEDGKVVSTYAAKIGDQGYETLDGAFAAAAEGEIITLLADATPTLTSQRAITKAAVIDLGGKTLTLTEDDLYFGTTTFKNGTIVVDPSVKPSTAVFWMFANQTLTFDNVKIVATGVTGTYLIGLDGNNSDLNLLNGSEIVIENTTALDLDVICVNASTGNDIVIDNSKVKVTNLDGRVFFRGNYTVSGTSDIDLSDITKAGFRIEAGQTLTIADTATVDIVGAPRDGGIHLTDKTATYTKADTATVNATVNAPAPAYVAQIGTQGYETLAAAIADAKSGDEIVLLADVAEDVTVPAGVIFNGNGKQVGNILALGEITFKGHTKAVDFDFKYVNSTVNIGAGACLELTGTARLVIGHGATFNITGTIADAKTADKATIQPSLIMPGASITGAGVTFNVTNAYVKVPSSYCSTSSSASGTFNFNIENSIWESAGKLAFEAQSTAATVNFELKNSVLTTGSYLVFGVAAGEVVIDNSNVNVGKSNQIENRSTMTIKNGSVVNGAVATSSNAINPGTVIVENATYAVSGQFSGSTVGTGTLIIKNGANVTVGSIVDKANIQIDAAGMAAGDEVNFTGNLSKFAGTVEVINNDKLEAKIVDGKIVLSVKPPVKVSTKAELDTALAAAKDGDTIILTADIDYGTTQLAITKAITLDLGGKTLTTRNAYGGMSVKGNPTIKNGTIVHASNTAAIKVWNATAFEDLVIDVQGKGDANKTIGGIVLQSGTTTRVGSIKNVTIKGVALTNGIETYNCGDATENVIGSMENVNIDALGTGMLISAPCGTATNCSIKGGTNGIEIFIKGTYSASLNLVDSAVEGGVFAHDEFSSNPDIINNGTLSLTGVAADDVTLTLARAEENVGGVLEEIVANAQAKVNDTYYATLAAAMTAAKAGDIVTIFEGTYVVPSMKAGITVVGEGEVLLEGTLSGTLENLTLKNLHIKGGNAQRWAYAKGNLVFENVTFEATSIYALHFDGITAGATLQYKDCTIIGWAAMSGSPASCVFDGCTIKGNGTYGLIRTYFDATIEDCTFDVANVNPNDAYQDGIHAVGGAKVTVNKCTNVNGEMKDLVNVNANSVVVLDGVKIQNVAKIGDKYYATLADAMAAAKADDIVTILAGNYTTDLSVGNGITVVGETDAKGNNLVNITGRVSASTGATVKNLNVHNEKTGDYDCALAVNGKDIVIDGVKLTGYNGMRYCYATGDITIKNSTINGSYFAVHFDGSNGGNLVIDNCDITGWVSYGGGIDKVTLKNSTFDQGSYAGQRSYADNLVIEGCTFEAGYTLDIAVTNSAVAVTDSQMSDGSDIVGLFKEEDAVSNTITVEGNKITYVAKIGNTHYATLEEALANVADWTTIKLVANATLDYNAREAYGRDSTTDIIIDGQGFTLTLNQKDSDWSSIGMKNADGKLTLKNMTIEKTGYGATSGAWNTHAIIFSCNVEMNNVTVKNGIAVQNGATLNNVTINEANGYYGLWINGNGQSVTVNGGAINATNGGRGIKIADEYIDDPKSVNLSVTGTVFNTAKKAAVLVSSKAGAAITASNVDITKVAADTNNFVWVDEDWADSYTKVTVTGGSKAQENADSFAAKLTDADGNVLGYFMSLDAAIAAAKAGDIVTIFEGTYVVPSMKAGITVVGEGEVLLEGTLSGTLENLTLKNLHIKGGNAQRWAYAKGNLVFENVTFEATGVYALHFDGITAGATLTYKNCTIIGWAAMSGSPASCTFEGCTFEGNGTYGLIRTYFDATIKDCTFDVDNVNTTDIYQDGIHAVSGAVVTVNNCTNVNGDMEAVVNVSGTSVVVLDGVKIQNIAKIGDSYYATFEEALAAAQAGNEIEILVAGTYKVPSGKDLTITGAVDGVVFDDIGAHNMGGASVTFNNVTFDYYPNVNYTGLQHSGNLVYNNCTINGQVFLYGASETFNTCTFNQNSADAYNVWTYGAKEVAFNECTFNSAGKSVLIYAESADITNDVTVTKSTFNASSAVEGKAAIEMDSSLSGEINLTITNTTATGFGNGNVSGNSLWNNKKGNNTDANNDITVVVDDKTVLAPVTFVAYVDTTGYTTLAEAIKAAKAGDTVKVMAGNYTTDLSVGNGITVVGETDANGNNLVNITGRVSASTGATVKNLNVHNEKTGDYDCALAVNGKDIVIDGVKLTGYNGMRYCYAKGDITIQNSVINASYFAIHFDGSNGGNLVIDNCDITGWVSYGGGIDKVTLKNSRFDQGSYAGQRSYADELVIENSTFKAGYKLDLGVTKSDVTVINSKMSDGSSIVKLFNEEDAVSNTITVDDNKITYVAKIGNTHYATLEEALEAVTDYTSIKLVADATLDYNAREAYGRDSTTDIIIDGQGFTLTLNQKNSDWASIGMKNADGKLTLKNMTIEKTGYGDTSGAWNTHAIIFSCNVEMNNVTVNNGIAVQNGATLNNVTINEANGYYGLWINGNGQTVTVNGGEIIATNGGRGIKIADQYIDAPESVTLNVTGTKFTTAKKAAVLVSSKAGAAITASNVDIENVAEDNVNFVWVDEDWAANYGEVTVEGADKAQENAGSFTVKLTDAKGNVLGYYKTLQAAIDACVAGDNTITLLANSAEDVTVSQTEGVNIVIDGNDNNYSGTITINGNNRYTGEETLIIQNVNFVTDVEGHYFIDSNVAKWYAHNVTVKNSTFAATGAAKDTAVAMRIRQGFDIAIENVTTNGLHSVLQGYGIKGVTVDGLNIESGKNGLSMGTSTEVVVKNSNINTTGYGIRADGNVAATLTAENVTITAAQPIVVRNNTNANYAVVLNGNNTLTAPKGEFDVIFTTGADDADYVAPTHAINIKGAETLDVFPAHVANIGNTYYTSLQEAVNAVAEGGTIELLADRSDEMVFVKKQLTIKKNNFEADLYAGKDANKKSLVVIENETHYVVMLASALVEGKGEALAYIDLNGNGTRDEGEALKTLQDALDEAAVEGTVVRMTGNIKASTIIIPSGVTLDLQSNTLTADRVIGLNGSFLTANVAANTGKLVVPAKDSVLLADGCVKNASGFGILPVWVADHYEFSLFTIARDMGGSKFENGVHLTVTDKAISMNFRHRLSGDYMDMMYNDGGIEHGVKVIVKLTWENPANGVAEQTFTYVDSLFKSISKGEKNYTFTLTEYAELGIDLNQKVYISAAVITDCGMEISSDPVRVEITN